MIVKNEEENLPRLFESIKDCFDEIHITDTGSTDRTVEIAKSLGAQVHHFSWVNNFAAARNASFEPVTTDYVMWMDGDDVLENREGFLQFRDNVMALADYWVATYHYASDDKGNPVCSFARERIFKRDKGMRWKYFVHEGVVPNSQFGPIRMQYTRSWNIRHMRTENDLAKDRSRNLTLFEENKAQLDARMRYYYGKELVEAGKPVEAAAMLLQAIADPTLEIHDRILGFQYACYAYIQCNQFERAIDLAHSGLQLAPNRAEFHALIGDCYLKLGKLTDAIPSYHAAKACQTQLPDGYAGVIFTHMDSYGSYPRNQLARIHANMGDLEKGEKEAVECVERFKNAESEAILTEIRRIKSTVKGFKEATPCDDIVITCPPAAPYLWDADIAKEKSMGGSETAAIEMAYWLHKVSGRPVKIFNVRETDKVCDGVEYITTKKVGEYMAKNKPFLHIAWRHNFKITDAPTFLWCHDLVTQGGENHDNYDRILCLTPFHKRYVMAMQGIPEHKIHVTRNGIKPGRFQDGPWEKDPFRFVFGSSPDRGLDRAMRVLDRVRVRFPEVKLHVHYGIEHLHKYGLGELAKNLKAMMDERKDWVVYHGATQQEDLMKSYKASAYCVQPSDWIETSMISAMELTCAGVYPVMRRIGGVADTLAVAESLGMATLIDSDCITEREHDLYASAVIQAIEAEAYKRVKIDAETLSWKTVAEEWLRDLPALTEGRNVRCSA